MPADAKVSLPGLALANAIKSCAVMNDEEGFTHSTSWVRDSSDTGMKSLRVSYGSLSLNRPGLVTKALSTIPIV
jgi:hypothetical protein